jgi:5-methylcytosine-specific restriction protein A
MPEKARKFGHVAKRESKPRQFQQQKRPSPSRQGYDRRWQRYRVGWLARHPLCEDCLTRGIVRLANEVHHKVKHRGNPELLYDENNLMSLCTSCHSRRTARGE